MALKSQVWKVLAAKFGGSAATLSKADLFLTAAGYSIPGSRGGGRDAIHATDSYLSAMVLSTAGIPSEAGDIVRAARECRYRGSTLSVEGMHRGPINPDLPLGHIDVPGLSYEDPTATLDNYVARVIRSVAVGGTDAIDTVPGYVWDFEHSRIRVDFEPFAAQVEWRTQNGVVLTDYFLTPSEVDAVRHLSPREAAQKLARPRRSSVLPIELLFTAAELLADGWAKTGNQPTLLGKEDAPSGQEEASASASPTNEKTPDLPGSGASNHANLPQESKAGNSHTPGNNIVRAQNQARMDSRGASPGKGPAHEVRY